MLTKFKRKIKSLSIILWLILLTVIIIFVTNFQQINKNSQYKSLEKTLSNVYLQKSFAKITSGLENRYIEIEYIVEEGDNYESIINKIKIPQNEKKLFLETVKKNKKIKILRPNQKIFFKLDKKNYPKIEKFVIEISKKQEINYVRDYEKNIFNSKLLEKELIKIIAYKESIITNSLYQSALSLKIKPNIIIEFARLYGFQVDFQRDIWKNDSFQIIYEEFVNKDGNVIETGNIIFANLNLQNQDLKLYRHEYEKNKIDYFDESGKSMRKTLMKTPINGARLSSSFGKRKHPILGFT